MAEGLVLYVTGTGNCAFTRGQLSFVHYKKRTIRQGAVLPVTLGLPRPRVVQGGRKKCRHEPSIAQTHHELFSTHAGVMGCPAQPLRGSTTTKRAFDSTTCPNRLQTHTHSPMRIAHPRPLMPLLSSLTARATHARPLHPASLAPVPSGIALVRVCASCHKNAETIFANAKGSVRRLAHAGGSSRHSRDGVCGKFVCGQCPSKQQASRKPKAAGLKKA